MFRLILFLFSLLSIIFCESNSNSNSYPNVILILTDDQGWGDLSSNGNRDINTPNIDKIASSGVKFDRFFVSPVCSPTRAEILTGRHHVRTGVYDVSRGGERMDLDEETIAKLLDTQLLHLENGTMECKPLTTLLQEVLMNFMDFVLAIGETTLIQSWKKMEKSSKERVL